MKKIKKVLLSLALVLLCFSFCSCTRSRLKGRIVFEGETKYAVCEAMKNKYEDYINSTNNTYITITFYECNKLYKDDSKNTYYYISTSIVYKEVREIEGKVYNNYSSGSYAGIIIIDKDKNYHQM